MLSTALYALRLEDPLGGRLAQREPQVLPLLRRQQSLLGVFRAPATRGIGLAPVVAGEAPPLLGHLRAHQDGLAPKERRSKLKRIYDLTLSIYTGTDHIHMSWMPEIHDIYRL